MRNKKKIPGGRIFVEESLTKLRGKLFYAVRKDDNTLKSWTQEGKIYTNIKGNNNEEVLKIITTPMISLRLDGMKIGFLPSGIPLKMNRTVRIPSIHKDKNKGKNKGK